MAWLGVELLVGPGLHPQHPQPLMSPLPIVDSFKVPEDFQGLVEQQCIGATTQLLTQTDFPLQSYEPKVQVPFQVLPGQCPRKTEIERYAWGSGGWRGKLPQGGSICWAGGIRDRRP